MEGLLEGDFASDAGKVPAELVVTPKAAEMKNNAVYLGCT